MLRTFFPPTQNGVLQVQESQHPDEVVLVIENGAQECVVSMTQAQFRELCRLGLPDSYARNPDTVRFQPKEEKPTPEMLAFAAATSRPIKDILEE